MDSNGSVCPNCSADHGIKFKCDHCGSVFCDYCEAKKKIDTSETHFLIQFFCPNCDSTASRIPIPALG